MIKLLVAILTLMFSLGATAQVDSIHGGTKTGTVHESDADLKNGNNNSTVHEKPAMQDSVKIQSGERNTIQNIPHGRDTSGTMNGQQMKSKGNMQNPKPAQHENSGVKTTSPTKQEQPKKVATEKDKMYLVPDSTVKK